MKNFFLKRDFKESVIATDVSELKAGDYVIYNSSTSYKGNWIVIYDSQDTSNGEKVEIISEKITERVTLGGDTFEEAKLVYVKMIKILNEISKKYLNPLYADDTRCVGSNPNNPGNFSEIDKEIVRFKYPIGEYEKGLLYQKHHSNDIRALINVKSLNIKDTYWIASRDFGSISFDTSFLANSIYSNGLLYSCYLCDEFKDGTKRSMSETFGYRPVISLKKTVKIISGSGIRNDPYILG